MSTSTSLRRGPLSHRRRALLLGAGVATLALALVTGRLLALQHSATDRLIEGSASYVAFPTLESLTQHADLVLVGQVVGEGTTYLVPQPAQVVSPKADGPSLPADVPQEKAQLAKQEASGKADSRGPSAPAPVAEPDAQGLAIDQSLPKTAYSVRVSRVIKGDVPAGTQVTVTQAGGKIQLPTYRGGPKLDRTVQFEHDALMRPGDEHMLFLGKAEDGTYYIVGGPQGRFNVRNGLVEPIDPEAPLAQGLESRTVEEIASQVRSVK